MDDTTDDVETDAEPVADVLALARSLACRPENLVDPWVLTHLALRAVPGARSCGISVVRADSGPETLAATDPEVSDVDALQRTLHEGPVLHAAHSGRSDHTAVHDLGSDPRWPTFGPQCSERTGIHAALVTTLELTGSDVATLSHYATDAGAFDEADVAGVAVLAPIVTLAIQSAPPAADIRRLRSALAANHHVGTATGILMARHGTTSTEAFRMLRRASEQLGLAIHEVAREVMDTGRLPTTHRAVASGQASGQPRRDLIR